MWDGYNKVGYLSADGVVIYPKGRGIARHSLSELLRRGKGLTPIKKRVSQSRNQLCTITIG